MKRNDAAIQANGLRYHEAMARCGVIQTPAYGTLPLEERALMLAGVLPFQVNPAEGEAQFLIMRPKAKHAHLPPPELQLCKGTRMCRDSQSHQWRDITDAELPLAASTDAEPLAVTALREGHEELGLLPENIAGIYALGVHAFQANSGKQKTMMLYGVTLKDTAAFIPPCEILAATQETRWLSMADAMQLMRKEHAVLLPSLVRSLHAVMPELASVLHGVDGLHPTR